MKRETDGQKYNPEHAENMMLNLTLGDGLNYLGGQKVLAGEPR